MRRTLLPLAALALTATLAGCGAVGGPTPTPTPTATETPTAPPTATPTEAPTTVDSMPGVAFLRVSATAEADGEEVRLELTFARAQTAAAAPQEFAAVQQECANAIQSQLEVYPGLEPTGVITSELSTFGDWPEGASVAIAAGGIIASYGGGSNVAPTEDEPGTFGCTVPIVTGPGAADFVSLLLGDPAIADRTDLDAQLARGRFGFESDGGSGTTVRWRDCVIQLSSSAQRLASANGWTQQTAGNVGCSIGDDGSV
jgi:predicted small lipoprotein YifL